jgi:hypothetical protein
VVAAPSSACSASSAPGTLSAGFSILACVMSSSWIVVVVPTAGDREMASCCHVRVVRGV